MQTVRPPSACRRINGSSQQAALQSNHQQMTGAVRGAPPPLVVYLLGGDVLMAEQFLDLADVVGAIEQQRGVGGPQRMRRIKAALLGLAIPARRFL